MSTHTVEDDVGSLLRRWRHRRRVSQLDLAHRAGVSTRHVSFIETGRSRPTSAMILRLCDHLGVPLREQNRWLLAAGFAPAHAELPWGAPAMVEVARAVDGVLTAAMPFPALVIDAGWDLVDANDAVYALLDGVDPRLLEPPVNVVRLSLDARGLAPRILNLEEWRAHLLGRLQREYDIGGDPRLTRLLDELGPDTDPGSVRPPTTDPGLLVPLRLRVPGAVLSLVSTTTVFGTPREVTLAELAIETFYPADDATRVALTGRDAAPS